MIWHKQPSDDLRNQKLHRHDYFFRNLLRFEQEEEMVSAVATNKYMEKWYMKFNPGERFLSGRSYLFVKRLMDLGLVVVSLPFWLPIMGIISAMIALTSPGGPVIFIQFRTGRGGKRFQLYKFRTMVPNAEDLKVQYAKLNASGDLAGPLKLENDPRITKFGYLLRKTSLDELPQIFNVMAGDMSIVGPRPTSWSPESYKLWQTGRLDVLPGITGLWQICGRGSEDFNEWLKWDIRYIERRSIWFDIMIIIKTIVPVFKQWGAR
jgi:lipopolysaccharide/colanic/teichoic acid biosynthesis glycosyltransferase